MADDGGGPADPDRSGDRRERPGARAMRRAAGDWWMFAVNSGSAGCGAASTTVEVRRSADGLVWGPPKRVALEQPDLWPWHIDVQWIPSRQAFWALYNAKTAGACTTPAVYLAESADGITW